MKICFKPLKIYNAQWCKKNIVIAGIYCFLFFCLFICFRCFRCICFHCFRCICFRCFRCICFHCICFRCICFRCFVYTYIPRMAMLSLRSRLISLSTMSFVTVRGNSTERAISPSKRLDPGLISLYRFNLV